MYDKVLNLMLDGELTQNETTTLIKIMDYLSIWEPDKEKGFSDLDPTELAELLNKPIQQVRGYLGSLVKKEYIEIEGIGSNSIDNNFIYITDKTRRLYNETN